MNARIMTIERHRLSDGGLAMVNRFGRRYTFTRTYNSFTRPPDVSQDLSKDEAMTMLADTLRNDVLEVE